MNCDWCDGGATDLFYDRDNPNVRAEIEEDGRIYIYDDKKLIAYRKANFCPMCGRPFNRSKTLPIWTTCYQCKHRGIKLFCMKCTRNSFAPSGCDKVDCWVSCFETEN